MENKMYEIMALKYMEDVGDEAITEAENFIREHGMALLLDGNLPCGGNLYDLDLLTDEGKIAVNRFATHVNECKECSPLRVIIGIMTIINSIGN